MGGEVGRRDGATVSDFFTKNPYLINLQATRVNHNKVATCVAIWGKKSTCQSFLENMNFPKFSTSS